MKLRTLIETLTGLDTAVQEHIIREASRVPLKPSDIPESLYPLVPGNYVDFGMEDYPPEYADVAGLDKSESNPYLRWARAMAGGGVGSPMSNSRSGLR